MELIKILTIIAIALYLISGFTKSKISLLSCVMGLSINLLIFILNWIESNSPPFGNMYHVMIFSSLCFIPLYLIIKYRNKLDWLFICFILASVLPLIGSLFMDSEKGWKRMPALQSPWFVPHVTAYMMSYTLVTVAFIISLVYFIKKKLFDKDEYSKYSNAVYEVILLSFPLMTFGMLSGALWAEEVWGKYWSWDIKETWALITWFVYIAYFHIRRTNLKKHDLLIQIIAFLSVLFTFLVVNYSLISKIKSALHSYG